MSNTKDGGKYDLGQALAASSSLPGVFSDVPGLADAMTAAVTTAIVEAPILLDGESPDPALVEKLKLELGCCGQCGADCRATKAAARKG